MKKEITLFAAIASFAILLIPPYLPAQPDCPSCSSFGVQRFSEKKEPPPFSLKELGGNFVARGDCKGKPMLLFFWATWCPSCKEEIVLLEQFYAGKKDQFTLYAVVIDGEKEKRVRQAVKDTKTTIPVLLDIKEKIARAFGVKMVPSVFLIDQEGLLVGAIVGQRDWSSPEAWSSMKELFHLR